MRKTLLFFGLLLCVQFTLSGQSFQEIKIIPTTATTNDNYVELQTYFLEKYPEKVSGVIYDFDSQYMVLNTILQPLDVLQILRKLSHESIYFVSDSEKYVLSPDALRLKFSK